MPKPIVFISHRTKDADLAEKLAKDLEKAGFQIWLDTWEIYVGDSIIEKMNSGLKDCQFFILCYSDAGIHSPWISREWMSVLARKLNGDGVKFLPVRLSGKESPVILADIKCIDLAKNWKEGVSELLLAMR